MKSRNTIVLIIVGLILAFGINYVLFTGILQGLPPAVEQAMISDDAVSVSFAKNKLTMTPAEGAEAGLVMYGEGKEDVRMYAPIARMLAESGIKVVVMSRRLEMRISEEKLFSRIAEAIAVNPSLPWYSGGHTSGARTPVKYALLHPDDFNGIVLWAARLSDDSDLSGISLPVLYVYGTLDDVNVDLVSTNRTWLPEHTEWISIEGANRADFSYWGPMAADVGSTTPIPEIQRQAAEATIAFMLP
ncbi:MAG: alpha/beta hydrolase [Anaerolineae bacterium]|nr:alpha/beta hydrolase [Anaerolineae bacterium]